MIRTLKRLVTAAAAAVMLASGVPAAADYDLDTVTQDGCVYKIYSYNNTAYLYELTAKGDVVIPETVEGYTVVSVGYEAAKSNSGLTSITLPFSVKTIENSAFADCSMLETADLGGVEYIGEEAFTFCNSLSSVEFGTQLIEIDDDAFRFCPRLTNLAFPESLSRIGERAFMDNRSLYEVYLPDNIVEIGDYAFGYYTAFNTLEQTTEFKKLNLLIYASPNTNGAYYGLQNGITVFNPYGNDLGASSSQPEEEKHGHQGLAILVIIVYTVIVVTLLKIIDRHRKGKPGGRTPAITYRDKENPLPGPEGDPRKKRY